MRYSFLYSCLLSTIFIISYYCSHELATILYFGIIFLILLLNKKIDLKIIKHITPLLILFFMGLCIGILKGKFGVEYFFKDMYYLLKPIICILCGYYLMCSIKNYNTLILTTLYTSTLLSSIRLFQLFFAYLSDSIGSELYNFRIFYGSGSILIVVGISLVHLLYKHKIKLLSNKYLFLLFVINFSAIMISFSRTYMVCMFISFIVIGEYYKVLKLKNIIYLIYLLLLAVAFLLVNTYLFESTIFQEKIAKTFDELLVNRYNDIVTINTLWRGYESFIGVQDFLSSSFFNKIFGNGYGHEIDLKLNMPLGDSQYRFISYTHNGYVYVLIKHGLLGICLYLYWFYSIMKKSFLVINSNVNIDLLKSLSIQLIIVTFVITGIFNKDILLPYLLLLGTSLYFKNYESKI